MATRIPRANQGALALTELTLPISANKFLVPDVTVVRRIEQPYPSEAQAGLKNPRL